MKFPVPFALFAVSIFMILDLDGFNKVFDVVNLFYFLLLFPVFLLYKKRREEYDSEFEHKSYIYKKVKGNEPNSWQEQFAGKWVKVERTNFYEFMVWNGVPSFIASLKKDADFAQSFSFDPNDDWKFEFQATGTPSLALPWMTIGKTEEDAQLTDCKDPSGTPMQLKFWYDRKDKILRSWGINPSKIVSTQTRKIDENGLLQFTHTHTKPDGTSSTYTAVLRKVT